METLLVALIADGVFSLTWGVAVAIMLAVHGGASGLSQSQLEALSMQGRWLGAGIIVAAPPTIAVLWIAIRMARREFGEYLALNWPSGGEIVRALAIMTIVLAVEGYVTSKVGTYGPPQTNPYLVVGGASGLLAWLVGSCIAGPVLEEFVVRGFMFRGWSQSFLGPTGTIVLTSALWAMNHTQYDWYGRFNIFFVGLALGHLRSSSNSTWLTVVAHSANNIFITFVMGPYI